MVPVDGQRIKRFEAYNMYCQTRRQGVMWCPDQVSKSHFASFSAAAGMDEWWVVAGCSCSHKGLLAAVHAFSQLLGPAVRECSEYRTFGRDSNTRCHSHRALRGSPPLLHLAASIAGRRGSPALETAILTSVTYQERTRRFQGPAQHPNPRGKSGRWPSDPIRFSISFSCPFRRAYLTAVLIQKARRMCRVVFDPRTGVSRAWLALFPCRGRQVRLFCPREGSTGEIAVGVPCVPSRDIWWSTHSH